MNRDDSFLLDILKAAKRIIDITAPLNMEKFLDDVDAREITLWQFAVIGEAVNNLSDVFRRMHPDIPWRSIVDMRNRLIHGYREIDLEEVWRTIQVDVPELIRYIRPFVPPDDES